MIFLIFKFLNFSCNCLYIIIFPLSSDQQQIRDFEALSIHHQLSYKRLRGPICKPGAPLKVVPVATFLSKDETVTYRAQPKRTLNPITPNVELPGKYINLDFYG